MKKALSLLPVFAMMLAFAMPVLANTEGSDATVNEEAARRLSGRGSAQGEAHVRLFRDEVLLWGQNCVINPYIVPGQEDLPKPGDFDYAWVNWAEIEGVWSTRIPATIGIKHGLYLRL